MKRLLLLISSIAVVLTSCGPGSSKQQSGKPVDSMENKNQVKLIIVDPGHFHAALVQKSMYPQVSPDVHLYAPEGPDYKEHLKIIQSYNSRPVDPTSWNEIVYSGADFFDKMLKEKAGNVVILSGNNKKKAEYITKSINAGLNVLADKPMIITSEAFPELEAAFATAKEKGLLLFDIMTERYEITNILQKLLINNADIFGTLVTGSAKEPALSIASVHHFTKLVSGNQLIRPAWFFDVDQQGDGLVDITTHLVDMVQWQCFHEQPLNISDVKMVEAKRWPTIISSDEFKGVTGLDKYPDYLAKDVKDGKLNVFSNGEMIYQLKGVFSKISVEWKYQAPAGSGDTHYSVARGTKCDVAIRQGAEEKFVPTLYVENIKGVTMDEFTAKLKETLKALPYDSLGVEAVNANSLKINIPQKYKVGHESHFGQVTSKYLEYLKDGKLPEWEVQCMITKYYITTTALKMAKGGK